MDFLLICFSFMPLYAPTVGRLDRPSLEQLYRHVRKSQRSIFISELFTLAIVASGIASKTQKKATIAAAKKASPRLPAFRLVELLLTSRCNTLHVK